MIFLSTGMLEELARQLILGGYQETTPAAIVYKATWQDEKKIICTVGTLAERARDERITKTALILVGDAVSQSGYERSKLYDPCFTTEFRQAQEFEGEDEQEVPEKQDEAAEIFRSSALQSRETRETWNCCSI